MPVTTRGRSALGSVDANAVSHVVKKDAARSKLGDISNRANYVSSLKDVKKDIPFSSSSTSQTDTGKYVDVAEPLKHFGLAEDDELDPIDEPDLDNPRYAAVYISAMMEYYKRESESPDFKVSAEYMNHQKDINSKMRELLVDWLNLVHSRFQLSAPTFFLAITYLDRFLAKISVKRDKLQLVGCACLWIASKFEEIYAPEIEDFVTISDNSFAYGDMLKAEKLILEALDYKLAGPTIYMFLRRYLKVLGCNVPLQHTASFLAELSQQVVEGLVFSSDLLAACIVWFAALVQRQNVDHNKENFEADEMYDCYEWDETMVRVTGYNEAELRDGMVFLKELVLRNRKSAHEAAAKKYSHEKCYQVSKLDYDIDFDDSEYMDLEEN